MEATYERAPVATSTDSGVFCEHTSDSADVERNDFSRYWPIATIRGNVHHDSYEELTGRAAKTLARRILTLSRLSRYGAQRRMPPV